MARDFERINISEAESSLQVEIDASDRPMFGTRIEAVPAMSQAEYEQLVAHSEFGPELTYGYLSECRVWITLDGEPNPHHIELGMHVAEELLVLRGIKAGSVSVKFPDCADSYIIVDRSI